VLQPLRQPRHQNTDTIDWKNLSELFVIARDRLALAEAEQAMDQAQLVHVLLTILAEASLDMGDEE
jgi:hypothetical protein